LDHPVTKPRTADDRADVPNERLNGRHNGEQNVPFFAQLRGFFRRNLNWFLLAALVALILQDVFGTHGVLAMRRSQKEVEQARKEIQQISDENQKLQENVKALKTDPQAIERIAREEMGLARPGEYVFKIQPKAGDADPAMPSSAQPVEQPAESQDSTKKP
jgi:cell division protein FtsB